jgi:hypothetical protein
MPSLDSWNKSSEAVQCGVSGTETVTDVEIRTLGNIIGVTIAPAGLDDFVVQCIFTLVPSKRPLPPIPTRPSLLADGRAGAHL